MQVPYFDPVGGGCFPVPVSRHVLGYALIDDCCGCCVLRVSLREVLVLHLARDLLVIYNMHRHVGSCTACQGGCGHFNKSLDGECEDENGPERAERGWRGVGVFLKNLHEGV